MLVRPRARDLGVLIVATTICGAPGFADSPPTCSTHAVATTLEAPGEIPTAGVWTFTGLSLQVTKLYNQSDLFYTNQITFEASTPQAEVVDLGAQFQMNVKDSNGVYIMPPMETGAVAHTSRSYYNAMMSDTVYDQYDGSRPPAGKYTFELWALSGGPNLLIVPFMSNIAVLELPRPGCTN